MHAEIKDPVILYLDSLAFKQLLHQVFMPKMVFPGQKANAVYNPVGGYVFALQMGRIHGPADHSR